MKELTYFKNKFPLEPLLPELKESEIRDIVEECDYTIEANEISNHDKLNNEVNIPDAVIFYNMGYYRAKQEIERKLELIEKNEI
jgi:hypothetical protein